MQKVLIDLLMTIITKLLTERFISKLTVRALWWLSQLTTNTVDDGIVADVAAALKVEDYK